MELRFVKNKNGQPYGEVYVTDDDGKHYVFAVSEGYSEEDVIQAIKAISALQKEKHKAEKNNAN